MDVPPLFHVSHSLCRPFFGVRSSPHKHEKRTFSATESPSQPTRQYFLRPSLLFPSETHLKTCGKTAAKLRMEKMCKTCGKSADFLRITPRKSVQKPVDNLRGRRGKPAENASTSCGLNI